MSRLAIVTDGSPAAAALAAWLAPSGSVRIEARSSTDVGAVVAARRGSDLVERIVTVSPLPSGGDVSAAGALEVAAGWLSSFSPIDARSTGASAIASRVAAAEPGAEVLQELAALITPRHAKVARPGRAGRPRGSDPFRGAGLEVVVALLLEPDREQTERGLAARVGRSPYGVHRVLEELGRRGYLTRGRGGRRVRDALLLRDDVVGAWRGRIADRKPTVFLSKDRRRAITDVLRAAKSLHREVRLAGPSAAVGPTASAGGPVVFYVEGSPEEVMSGAGFRSLQAGDVVVWPITEPAVLLAPRLIDGVPATNRVITYADLMSVPTDRGAAAAEAVWNET